MIISYKLLLYCVVSGGLYLLVLSLLLDLVERKLRLTAGIPVSMLEADGLIWSLMNFFMESLFYVVIPAIAYSFFYAILPLSGIKAGMASALFAFVLGAAPALMRMSVRVKLPMPYLLFIMLSHLLKLGGTLSIIAYLYAL
ncbi:MAG: hypothetical protein AB1644_12190 [Candidatus Zixiibacteriota bacterium]